MKKLKKIMLILFSVFLVFSIIFYPKRICSEKDNIRIDRIVYNSKFNTEGDEYNRIEVTDYDFDEVVNCISKYKSYLTLSRATGYQLKNSEIEIFLFVNGKSRNIVLGNINYVTGNYGKLKRTIVNADELKRELTVLLELDKLKGDKEYEKNY